MVPTATYGRHQTPKAAGLVPYLYFGDPKAADHKRKISDSKNEGLEILTCCLTVTYILGRRKKAAVRHPKRTLIVPNRAPIVPNRVPIVPKRIRTGPMLRLGGAGRG